MEGGAKFQCKPLEGVQNFSAERFEASPEAPREYLKKFAGAGAADHIQYNTATFANVPI